MDVKSFEMTAWLARRLFGDGAVVHVNVPVRLNLWSVDVTDSSGFVYASVEGFSLAGVCEELNRRLWALVRVPVVV